jgi:hypothetical protein
MAIQQLSRLQLNQEFRDGERPSGDDFGSAWFSFLHKGDDGVSIDGTGNVVVAFGVTLKDANDASPAGTLRFKGGQLQLHDGSSFKNVNSGGGGAFTPVSGGPSVAFSGGNVGIGTAAAIPAYRLEVPLATNAGTDQRVRFGNLAVHAGTAVAPGAYISHINQANSVTTFALFQDSLGVTNVNASSELNLMQNGVSKLKVISPSGNIALTPSTSVTVSGNLTVTGDVSVLGHAFKNNPLTWELLSDARVKKDVKNYSGGMQKLLALRPVTFKFNGKASTRDDGHEYIGLIAQEVKEVLPELILPRAMKLDEKDTKDTEVLTFDQGPLTFLLINAIKELHARIQKLEKPASDEKRKTKN